MKADAAARETRQKRVQPSRSRRGGPGIGSCEVDIMILETLKRKSENEPIIPADTPFFLTTNSALVPSPLPSASGAGSSAQAQERYFERPEVLSAYKAQQVIQTPEFSLLSEDASVGGRFRPRGLEDAHNVSAISLGSALPKQESADTSDAAYEKRHRKYETFEKRQRLREKEKLKHEQYKLKERIEQLRAMDGSAFLALPATAFSPALAQPFEVAEGHDGIANPAIHTNIAATHSEGERRRKEMLDVAMSLERRYRVLLPSDRKHLERDAKSAGEGSISAEPDLKESDSEGGPDQPVVEAPKIKLKIKFPARPAAPLQAPALSPKLTRTQKLIDSPSPATRTPLTRRTKQITALSSPPHTGSPFLPRYDLRQGSSSSPPSPGQFPIPSDARSSGSPSSQSESSQESGDSDGSEHNGISPSRPRKRVKTWTESNGHAHLNGRAGDSISAPIRRSLSHVSLNASLKGHTSAGRTERRTSALVTAALRTASAPKARKTQRHLTAFGTKVPAELDEVREYELPPWVRPGTDADEYSDASPPFTGVGAGLRYSVEPPVRVKEQSVTSDDMADA